MAGSQRHDDSSPTDAIDRGKLRVALRQLGDEYIYYMLDDAIELLPPTKLKKLVGAYLDLERLRPDVQAPGDLLAQVQAFEEASRHGEYYESFNVDSRNFMDQSKGTRAFIAQCRRLFDRCVAGAPGGDPAAVSAAIDTLVELLRYIDECHDDVIFFADEGGSWQVGVHWRKVLPAWFRCLARTLGPEDYARRVVELADELDRPDRDHHLRAARRFGTRAHRAALLAAAPTATGR